MVGSVAVKYPIPNQNRKAHAHTHAQQQARLNGCPATRSAGARHAAVDRDVFLGNPQEGVGARTGAGRARRCALLSQWFVHGWCVGAHAVQANRGIDEGSVLIGWHYKSDYYHYRVVRVTTRV